MTIRPLGILAFVAMLQAGCATSGDLAMGYPDTVSKIGQMDHTLNIVRIRHLVMHDSTASLSVYYCYFLPAYFWKQDDAGDMHLVTKIVDICDKVHFISETKHALIDVKVINYVNDRQEFEILKLDMKSYYEAHASK